MAKVLVIGGTGGVGSRLVQQLVASEEVEYIRLLARKRNETLDALGEKVEIIEGNIMQLKKSELQELVNGVDYIVSCLGHRMNALFSPPYNLCQKAIRKLITAVKADESDKPVKFIMINTTGVGNPDKSDKPIRSFLENRVLGALWVLLPPHRDNYRLSHYMYKKVGRKDEKIRWVVVRPDDLYNTDDDELGYEVYEKLQVSLFNPKKTQRLNVAKFMVELIINKDCWDKWEYKYPVVYNEGQFDEHNQ